MNRYFLRMFGIFFLILLMMLASCGSSVSPKERAFGVVRTWCDCVKQNQNDPELISKCSDMYRKEINKSLQSAVQSSLIADSLQSRQLIDINKVMKNMADSCLSNKK